MQEREIIQNQLENLQFQCLKQYLEGKLETITTKEVVSDILKGFIQISNVEFIQSITQSILQAKTTNKNLRKEIQQLKSLHSLKLQELESNLTKEINLANDKKFIEIIEDLKQKLKTQISQIQQSKQIVLSLEYENQHLKGQITSLSQKIDQSNKKIKIVEKQKETMEEELSEVKQNLNNQLEEKQKQNIGLMKKLEEETTSRKTETTQTSKSLIQLKDRLEQKQSEIQTLENDLFKLTQEKEEIEKCFALKSQENEIITSQLNLLKIQKQKRQSQFDSISLAKKYLQEENQFLREEIISFRQREDSLQQELEQLNSKIQSYTIQSNRQIESLNLAKLNLQEQLKQDTFTLIEKYQEQLSELKVNNQELKVFLQSHKEQLSDVKTKNEEITLEIQSLREENKCLYEQVKLHFEQSQVHENEIKCYEEEILKVNHDCRAQLDTFKQTYEINWNALHQELIQEKYKYNQLQEEKQNLLEEISLQKQKQKFYSMYVEEISHLKKQLQIVGSNKKYIFSRAELRFEDNKTKFYYYMSRVHQELHALKNQNKKLKAKFLKETLQYKKYFEQTILYLIVKIKEESLKCSFCQHQQNMAINIKHQKKDLGFQKTLPKAMSNEVSSFSSLKKTLKNVQQRYQIVNQSNKSYNDHISSIIKNA